MSKATFRCVSATSEKKEEKEKSSKTFSLKFDKCRTLLENITKECLRQSQNLIKRFKQVSKSTLRKQDCVTQQRGNL